MIGAMFAKIQNWIAKKSPSFARMIRFSFDGHTITADGPLARSSVRAEDIREIGIVTTEAGSFVEVVFRRINRDSGSFLIPPDSPAFTTLRDYFGSLEGFNWQTFTEATSCTDHRHFLCWRRPHESA